MSHMLIHTFTVIEHVKLEVDFFYNVRNNKVSDKNIDSF